MGSGAYLTSAWAYNNRVRLHSVYRDSSPAHRRSYATTGTLPRLWGVRKDAASKEDAPSLGPRVPQDHFRIGRHVLIGDGFSDKRFDAAMNKLILLIAMLSAGAWGYHYQTHSRSAQPQGGGGESASSVALQLPGPWGESLQYAYTAAVLAKLREYQVAQEQYRIEEEAGDFVYARSLPDLVHLKGRSAGHPGYLSQDLVNAWAGGANPVPYRGYLFAEITQTASGRSLDPHIQYGLCAYPVQPDFSGAIVLLVLNDERTAGPINEERPVSGGTYTLWAAPSERVKGPVTRWPSEAELHMNFVKLNRSISEAQQAINDLRQRAQRGEMKPQDLALTR